MLALAKPKLENGDWSENEENDEEEEITKPKPTIYDSLKRPEDMDLTGSFSARDRRREKQVLIRLCEDRPEKFMVHLLQMVFILVIF